MGRIILKLKVYNWDIEIKEKTNIHFPAAGYWKNKTVCIYDPNQKIERDNIFNIIQYMYDEGFLEDRRTEYEVITES
jgi:hypothetical protein